MRRGRRDASEQLRRKATTYLIRVQPLRRCNATPKEPNSVLSTLPEDRNFASLSVNLPDKDFVPTEPKNTSRNQTGHKSLSHEYRSRTVPTRLITNTTRKVDLMSKQPMDDIPTGRAVSGTLLSHARKFPIKPE